MKQAFHLCHALRPLPWTMALMLGVAMQAHAQSAEPSGVDSDARIDISAPLAGLYGLSTIQNCVRTPFLQPPAQDIDPATLKLLVDAEPAAAVGSGTMQFQRHGRVIAAVLGAELAQSHLTPGTAPSSTGIRYQCAGSYKLKADQSIAVSFPSCTVSSANPNVVVTVGPLSLVGHVSAGRRAIELALLDGGLQTVAVSDPSGRVLQARQRLCVQTMSLDRL